jgi:NAD(P)-dependent dehydrogenase (short-subunit alcohol dehydrogenase family)
VSELKALIERGFAGDTAIVLGGAGGVGVEVVAQLRDFGARVVVGSRRGAAPGADMGAPRPGEALWLGVDLTQPASLRRFADWAEGALGRLDLLVNAAGVTRSVPSRAIEALDDETIEAVMASNASGVLRAVRDLTPLLRRGRDPCFVNVGSVAARTGVGSNIAYVGAKAAMEAMGVALAKALAPEIRVVTVSPSALETDFAKGRGRDFLDRTIAATPLGRLATPTEVATAILCAARLLPMTTGATIFVDGGRHL